LSVLEFSNKIKMYVQVPLLWVEHQLFLNYFAGKRTGHMFC